MYDISQKLKDGNDDSKSVGDDSTENEKLSGAQKRQNRAKLGKIFYLSFLIYLLIY